MGTLLNQLHPRWAAHVVIDAQTGAILLSGATQTQYDRWLFTRGVHFRSPRDAAEVRPDLRHAFSQTDSCTHYLVEDTTVMGSAS